MKSSSVRLFLAQKRWFHTLSLAWRKVLFRVDSTLHTVSRRATSGFEEAGTATRLAWETLPSALFAVAFAGALLAMQYYVLDESVPDLGAGQEDHYSDLMLGIAGMGGVFIGLYYAAISAIVTQSYVGVASSIRRLLLADRVGRVYMRLLVVVTSVALVALGSEVVLGIRSEPLALIEVVLGIVTVVQFVRLGNRAFALLDHVALATEVANAVSRSFRLCTKRQGSTFSNEYSDLARREVALSVDTLGALAARSVESMAIAASAPLTMAQRLVAIQAQYVSQKSEIRRASTWFPRSFVHTKWYVAQDHLTSIAAQTGTVLHPGTRLDHLWLEERLDRLVRELLVGVAKGGRISILSSAMGAISSGMQHRAARGDVLGAVVAWAELSENLGAVLAKASDKVQHAASYVALADALASVPVSIALGFREYLGEAKVHADEGRLRKFLSAGGSLECLRPFPFHAGEWAEWLSERVQYEAEVEGRAVTPAWYCREILALAENKHLAESVDALLERASEAYANLARSLDDKLAPQIAASVRARQMEYVAKVDYCIGKVATSADAAVDARRIEGLKWPSLSIQELETRLRNVEDALVDAMSGLLSSTSLPESEEIPDFEGRFISEVGERAFRAAAEGDDTRFKTLFSTFAAASLRLAQRHRQTFSASPEGELNAGARSLIVIMAQVMDVAGYAFGFAELHRKADIWLGAKEWLDTTFKGDANASGQWLTAVLRLSEYGIGGIPGMSVFRQGRRDAFSKALAPYVRGERLRQYRQPEVNHPSVFVRLMQDSLGLGPEGVDLFSYAYLNKELGVPLSKLGYRASDIAQRVARAEGVEDAEG